MNIFKTRDICYMYDGSFYGMLCCIFEAFEKKELPTEIKCIGFSMFDIKNIVTDDKKAERILKAIPLKINSDTLEYVKFSFLSNIKEKEIALIHFLNEGFECGNKFIQTIKTGFSCERKIVTGALKNMHLEKIQKGIDLLTLESQRFIQFIRFSDIKGTLISIIEPENNILPLIASHFVERFINEQFLIYDKTHQMSLLYANGKISIEQIKNYQMPTLSQEEKNYQKLWKLFYDTIAIKERENEKCRMNFMPKKYWKNMTEFL